MTTLTNALIVVLAVNVMLFLGQAAMIEINPTAPQFINCEGTPLGSLEATGCTTPGSYVLNSSNPASMLPSGETSVSPETGVLFTDPFTAFKTWLLTSLGLSYLVAIVAAPYNFLTALGLPQAFIFAIGTLWYGVTLFLIIAFALGRDA